MVEQVQADIAEQDEPRPPGRSRWSTLWRVRTVLSLGSMRPFHDLSDLSKRGPAAQATPDSAVSWQATPVRRPVSQA